MPGTLPEMPELPEVETTRRGIAGTLTGALVKRVSINDPRLRWPVPEALANDLAGQRVTSVERRAKYILVKTPAGTLILHLGMSGSLRFCRPRAPSKRHDHVEIHLENGWRLVLNDPRRFGCALWTQDEPVDHPLLKALGPEPLGDSFTGDYLYGRSRGRRIAVKPFVMDAHIVVGVGNIYASESLHQAGINPRRQAGRIALHRMERLVDAIRNVLDAAIEDGGTTLRDFYGTDGTPGYFAQKLSVYDRAGDPCRRCNEPVRRIVLGQRATYYCANCQR